MNAVFLDRDGTIIFDPPDGRVDRIEKIKLFPDTIEALRLLSSLDFSVFIITNQDGIAEGRISETEFWEIHNKVLEMLAPSRIKILKTYMCPHGPSENSECRKPKPTMILNAAEEYNIDLGNSWMIGDHQTDVETGINAGTKTILVETGNIKETSPNATYSAAHLLGAIKYIAGKDSQ